MNRLVEFVTDFCIGGTERQVVNLARELGDRYELQIACFRKRGDFLGEIESRGIALRAYPIRSLFDPRSALQQARFARDMARQRVSIVRSYGLYPNLFALPAAWMARVPVRVASIRDTGDHLTPMQRRAERWACRFAARVVVNAEAVRRRLLAEGHDPRRIVVIPNGIDLARFPNHSSGDVRSELGLPATAPLVGVVARLNELKGIEFFIAAMAKVASRFRSARFLVVGDGVGRGVAYRRALERQASLLGLDGRLCFTGFRADVPGLLRELSVSVQPSLSEGLSNVVLESFAAGVPVVATAVGGNPEMVEDEVTGVLVPPRDADALAAAVCQMLRDPERARRMGIAARRRVEERFSLEAMVRRTVALYEELLATAEDPAWHPALQEEP